MLQRTWLFNVPFSHQHAFVQKLRELRQCDVTDVTAGEDSYIYHIWTTYGWSRYLTGYLHALRENCTLSILEGKK